MKLDRLMGILTALLQNGQVTAPMLAETFEVSRRTISRDIDALCRAGIPVVTRQGGGGGISLAEGWGLERGVLTADELSGLIAALEGLGSVSEGAQTERIRKKLTAGGAVVSLRESIVINLASHYQSSLPGKIELLRRAVREQTVIAFDYYSPRGRESRRVEPHFLIFRWTDWYLFAFCLQKNDWRLFKLNRLWNPSLGEQAFSAREIPPEKLDFDARFADSKPLRALFDPAVEYRLIEAYGPGSYHRQADGRLLLEIGFTDSEYILQWLLAFGAAATVLEPAPIAEQLRSIAAGILRNYEP